MGHPSGESKTLTVIHFSGMAHPEEGGAGKREGGREGAGKEMLGMGHLSGEDRKR